MGDRKDDPTDGIDGLASTNPWPVIHENHELRFMLAGLVATRQAAHHAMREVILCRTLRRGAVQLQGDAYAMDHAPGL